MISSETSPVETRIVIIDDEPQIRKFLDIALRTQKYKTTLCETGYKGLEALATQGADLVILDLGLPDLDGKEVLQELRSWSNVPVIVLSVRADEYEKVALLDAGANDYMTKPFSLEELVARLKSILRRTGVVETTTDEEKIRFADLELDEATHEVRRAGDLIELSPTEFTLLRYLLINADRVVSKAQILDHVWQYDFRGDAGIVETYISYLRKKIDIYEPPLIHTVRGVGYRLRMPAAK